MGQLRLWQLLKKHGAGLARDPRVFGVLQGPALARALAAVLRLSGRLSREASVWTGRVARLLGLASARDVEQLARRLERLETERNAGNGPVPAKRSLPAD